MHNSIIEINSQQFISNLNAIREHVNLHNNTKPKICLPLKANAYGHGLVSMAQLAEAYIDYFAVACLDEGVTLRQNGIIKPILVFGGFSEKQIPDLILNNLEITISSEFKAKLVSQFCKANNKSCKVHIEIETGMNRIGMRIESSHKLIKWLLEHPEIEICGIYSHLASSDELNSSLNKLQIAKFSEIAHYMKHAKHDVIAHLANSGGVCSFPNSYFNMIRPGIMCYGYLPTPIDVNSPLAKIKPCLSLKSKVIYFKVVHKNQGISYNHKYVTAHQTRVVTIPVGYGDGYRRMLSNVGEVLIRSKKYTISGTICMDMLMVDIGTHGEAYIDDEVVLIGKQGNEEITLESIAKKCNTITYEILCGFNERLPRVYV